MYILLIISYLSLLRDILKNKTMVGNVMLNDGERESFHLFVFFFNVWLEIVAYRWLLKLLEVK